MDFSEGEETDEEKDNELKKKALSDGEGSNKEKGMQTKTMEQKWKELAEKKKQAEIAARKQGEAIAKKMIEEAKRKKKVGTNSDKEAEKSKQQGDADKLVQPSTNTLKIADSEVIHSSLQQFAEEDPKFAKAATKTIENFAELIHAHSTRGGRKYKGSNQTGKETYEQIIDRQQSQK
ncbi:hypothetical protein CCACVL1_25443 [Corchorus capsularis]|uniref:Uncharacterized protein n=1 Tax=Corchorus capsularis TaxID=210143 RepID=A0A1R3GKI6_COCAP|nr:hypothetical protein CCACVL1_25443 [Corchorus capsularis]